MEQSKLLANIDVTIFTTNMKYKFYNTNVTNQSCHSIVFQQSQITIQYKHAPSKVIRAIRGVKSTNKQLQRGANLGMQLGFQEAKGGSPSTIG